MALDATAAFSFLAALFAYLGWVRVTARPRGDVERALSNRFEGITFSAGGYTAEIVNVFVTDDGGVEPRTLVVPFGRYEGETRMWFRFHDAKPGGIAERPVPDHGVTHVEATDKGVILGFDTTDADDLRERLASFDAVVAAIRGDGA